jgi:hypothetical protein
VAQRWVDERLMASGPHLVRKPHPTPLGSLVILYQRPTMTYGWRYFSSYRLNKDELEKFLKKKFGDWNFYIEVSPPWTWLFDAKHD